jgi:type IV pilus assembly protein PilA
MMFRRLKNQRGVTLVELMVVVAIIAIIAAIALTLYQDVQKKARLAADQGTLAAIRSAIAIYYGNNDGVFPAAEPAGPPLLQAAPDWQCPGASHAYDPVTGVETYTPNDISAC